MTWQVIVGYVVMFGVGFGFGLGWTAVTGARAGMIRHVSVEPWLGIAVPADVDEDDGWYPI